MYCISNKISIEVNVHFCYNYYQTNKQTNNLYLKAYNYNVQYMSNIQYYDYKIHFKKMGGLLTANALSDINRQPINN